MNIGILGTGHVAQALAEGWSAAGHEITLGSRNPATSKGLPYLVVSTADAVGVGDLIVNATPGAEALNVMTTIGVGAFAGKTLVDVTNALTPGFGLKYPDDSLGEQLQKLLPDANVVKTLNTVNSAMMAHPDSIPPSTIFLSGDDSKAKKTVTRLLKDLGWSEESILDIGGIASAHGPEHYFLAFGVIARKLGTLAFNIKVVS